MNKPSKNALQQSKLILEELEERRLFSGGIEGLIVTDLDSDANALYSDINGSQAQADKTSADTAAAELQSREIVFVDAGVDNHQQLVDDLLANSDSSRNIEVVVLDRDRDGIEQISATLQDRDELDAIHIISHGSDGSIELGNTSLTSETLEDNNLKIALWANSFAETGDILIYGCNLAASEIGQSLIDDLGALTLTDVAASDDATGHESLGGDWDLEYHAGEIDAGVVPSAELQARYQHILAVINGTAGDDVLAGTAANDVISAGAGNDVLVSGGGNDQMLGEADDDIFRFTGAQDGDVYTVDGGTGTDTIDLIGYASTAVTFGDGTMTIDMGGGQSFSIDYTLVNQIAFIDVTATVLTGSTSASGWSGTGLWIDGDEAFKVDMSGAGTIDIAYDTGSDTFSVTGASGVDATSSLAITDLNGTDLLVDQITLDASFGDLTTNVGIGSISLAGASSILEGTFTIGGDLGSINMYDLAGTLDVQGDLGTIHILNDLDPGALLNVTGDVTTLLVDDDIGGTVTIGGDVTTFDLTGVQGGSNVQVTASVTVTGSIDTLHIDAGVLSAFAIGGDLGTFTGESLVADMTVGGDVGSVTLASVDPAATFTADRVVGTLVFDVGGTDYGGIYAIPVQYVYNGSTSASVNETPVITSDGGGATANINVAENTTAVTTVTATDADLDTLTYSISGGADAALFNIDINSGVLTFISAPDFEAPADANADNVYEVTVQPSDGNGSADAQTISVTVTNIIASDGTVKSEQKISDTSGGLIATLDNNDLFGVSIAAIGDLDGDGINDIAVGAYTDDDGGTDRGAVHILFLNADGTVKSEQKISDTAGGLTTTLGNSDFFGVSVAAIGDVDGDGVTDLAVGAFSDDDGGGNRGAVYILMLNSDGTVKAEQKISDTTGGLTTALGDSDLFGMSVAGIGDIDGDGISDLAVGALFDDDGGTDRGGVYILMLNADGSVKAEQKISDTAGGLTATLGNNDGFGVGVAGIGDLDGDGINDIAVGAYNDDDGGTDRGAVHILFLNADGTVKAEQKISDTAGGLTAILGNLDGFGRAVAGVGDIDGDGINDIVVGAHLDDDGGTDRGAAHILFMNADGTVKAEQKISDTAGGLTATLDNDDGFGVSVAGIGDLDGDGVIDLAVGAYHDDDGGTDRGAVHILNLAAVDDNAPTAVNNTGASVTEGATHTITNTELRFDDSEQPASSVIYTVTASPVNGQLELTTNPDVAITSFTQAQVDASEVVYVHDGSATTSDEFKFDVDDGQGNTTVGQIITGLTNLTNLTNDAGKDRDAVMSPDGTQITFRSDRDGNVEIYVMDADGSNVVRLTNNAGIDENPSWSADGSQIVFSSDRDGNNEIYVMNADGSAQTRLTNNSAVDSSPSWSPDGTQIVFMSDRDGNNEIYVMDANGSNQIRLTNDLAADSAPAWSPDGSQIVFASDRDGNNEIYVMDANGSNQTRITNNAANDTSPSWSPDGNHILFKSDRDGNTEIYVMDADGSNPINLTTDAETDQNPSWSPDGTQILWQSGRDGDNEIYVADVLHENRFAITVTPANEAPTFIGNSIGNWNFDEGSGDSVAESAIGISTGTLGSTTGADANDPTWTTGKFGQALHFDGVDDYVEIADAPGLDISGPEFSASLWMNPDSGPNQEDMLFMKGDRQGNINYYLSWKNSNEMTWAFKDSAGWHYQDMAVTLPTTGQWNHIGITFDRPTVSLYVNGTKYVFDDVATGGSMDRDLTANNEVLWIGAGRDGGSIVGVNQWSGPFTGSIDELALFDRALTDADMEAIRTSTPPVVTASAFSIDENSANNTVVGTVVANDQDIGDTLSYAITAGNTGGAFSIDANGQIKVVNSAALDFETNPVFNLTVEATDDGTPAKSATTSVAISLNNVNDAPTGTTLVVAAVEETATAIDISSNVTDVDGTVDLTTTLVTSGPSNGALTNNGDGTFSYTGDLNFVGADSFTYTVEDNDGQVSSNITVTINVSDVNEAPVMTAWFNDAWDTRKGLTIDAASVAGDVTNFPVLITLNTDLELAAQALANGDDILFTAADGTTQLAHEIEYFDETTGELRVWVKADLSGSVDTNIYMYFGNAASGPQENVADVWDNYVGVYHLGESPTGAPGEIIDSSGSGNHATTEGAMDGADSVSTTIGQGLAFDGSNDMIRIPDSVSLDSITDEATFSLWINFVDTADGDTQIIMASSNRYSDFDGYEWAQQGTGEHFFYPDAGLPDVNYKQGPNPFTDGEWHHLAATMDFVTKEVNVYVDGTSVAFTYDGVTGNWTSLSDTDDLLFGGNPDRATRFFNGMMDEIRIADVARSQEWIQTEVNNQSAPGSFFSVGTIEDREDKLTDIAEDNFTSTGDSVLSIITTSGADRITDADTGAIEGIAVTAVDNTNGQWQYDANADGSWLAFGSVSDINAVLLDTGALIRFVPNADYNGSAGDLTFHAWDQTSGANGDTSVNVSTNGGSTAYSNETFDATLNVIPVADPAVIAGVDTGAVQEDVAVVVNNISTGGLLTIADPDTGESTFQAGTSNGTYGDLVIDTAGNWTYTADNTQAAIQQLDVSEFITDTLTVTSFDGTTHNVVITINGTEDASVISGTTTGSVTEDGTLTSTGTLVITDTDSSDPTSFVDVLPQAGDNDHGTFEITANSWIYVLDNNDPAVQALDAGETLTDTYTFTAPDGVTQLVTVTINGAEDTPVFDSTAVTAATEDVAYSYTISTSDVDVESVVITAPTLPAWLTFVDNGDGTAALSGTPTNAEVGNHNVVLNVSDGTLSSNQNFIINVSDVNDAPTGTTLVVAAVEETATAIDISGNVSDVDGTVDLTTTTVTSGPSNGSLINNGDGTFSYTGDLNFVGADSFTYTVEDNDGQVSSNITVTINVSDVNDAPTGTTLVVAAVEETATAIDISGNVADVDGTVVLSTTTVTGGPSNGSLINNNDGTFSYTGDLNFVGADSFTYTVEDNDGQVSSNITVTINVSDVNDAPTGTTLVVAAVEETATAIDISSNVADVDGTVDLTTTLVTGGPSNGSLTNNNDGTFSYTGDLDFVGADSFTYTVEDNDGQVSSNITVTINVSDVNDAPTGTTLVVAAVEETATAIDISGNVADVDGTVVLSTTSVTGGPSNGSLINNNDGTFSYTGDLNFVGADSFTYTVEDNDGQVSSNITVTINVSDVNDAPTGTTLVVAAVEETATAIDISSNVADVDGTVVLSTTTVTGGPSNGSLTNNNDGTFSYTGDLNFVGSDSFTYTVEDNDGQVSSDITVTINVSDVNDAPTGTTLVVAALEETATAIDISANVADVDGTVVLSTTTVTGGPSNGSLTNNGDGTFSYTGDLNFVGADSFTYTVEDNDGQVSSDITVTINVSDVNDAPTGTTLVIAALEETATAIDISSNVADVDGTVDLTTTTVTGGPSNGSLTNNNDGTFSYTGDTNFVGADSFTYTVEDNDGQVSSNITVTINVSDVNDAPTGTTLVVAAVEETATAIDISANVADVDGTVDLTTTTVTGGPSNGSLTNNNDGTFSYTGDLNFVGADSFTYTVEDNDGQVSSNITVTINVSDVNDAPTGTTLVVAAVEETATAIDISANVADVDGTVDLTTTTVTGGPSNGSLINNNDGTFSYTGDLNFVGADSFTYTVEDNDGQVSSDITVTINVSDVNDAPTGTTLVVAAVEETATAIDISANVADVDGTVVLSTTTVTGGPSNGSLINNGDGTFSYTGDTNYVGSDSFTYTVEDNDGQVSSNITVTINVSDVNDAPTGTTLVVAAVEETATAIDISSNVADVDGTVVLSTTTVTGGPSNGSLTNNGDGTFSYTGNVNFVGADSFTYTVEDNDGQVSSDITVTINVSDVNDAPTGTTLVVAAVEETATAIDISSNVADVDGTVDLTTTLVTSGPSNGSLTNNGDGTFSYTGDLNFVGADSFTYTVEDNDGQVSSDITVTINVSDVNDAPTGTTLVVAAVEETATAIDISANVADVDGTVVLSTTTVTGGPSNGSLTNNNDGTFSYTGNANFVGADSFTYTVEDNDGQVSSNITVTINVSDVNDAPTGTTLVVAAVEETATAIDISANVTDVDGTVVLSTTTVTGGPSNGSLTNNNDGTFSYTGNVNFVGADSFTYTVEDNDGQVSSDITVTINVSDVNDAPTGTTLVVAAIEETATAIDISGNVADVDGTVVLSTTTVTGGPSNGSLTNNNDGTFSYTGDLDFVGADSFTYTVEDNDGQVSSNITVTINVSDVNDAPTGTTLVVAALEETATAIDISANVADVDGTVVLSTTTVTGGPSNGSLINNGDGSFTYTGNADFVGGDSFTYTVEDNDGQVSSNITVTINVSDVNDAPTGTTLVVAAVEETATAIDISSNVADVDGTVDLTTTLVTGGPSNGSLTNNNDGTFSYTGDLDFVGADSFTYTVEDNDGQVSSNITVTINVSDVNDAPIGTTLVVAAVEETATAIDISGNVADVDGTVVLSTTTVTGGPSNGSLTNNGDGTFSYTGDLDFVGADSFTYTVVDNDGQVSSDITVTINVSDVNDAPTGTTLVVAALEETATAIDISSNVADVDGTVVLSTTTVTGGPSNGSLTNNNDGTFSYTGDADFVGADSFTYTVEDNDGQVSSDITVTISVSDVNDAPTGTTLVVAAVEETATAIDISGNVADVDGTVVLSTTTVTGGPSNGSLINNGDGSFTYTGNADFVGGDSFTYTVEDNDGQVSSDITVTITVNPVNDPAVIAGVDTGAVVEDVGVIGGDISTGGSLTIADPDIGESSFQVATINGAYGDLVIDIAGNWSYSADNSQISIQALDAGETLVDTLTVMGFDGTTHDVVVTINGTEDLASIGGTAVGAVAEDGALTASNSLTITDVDTNDNPISFNDVTPTPGIIGLGSFEMTGNTWTFTLNNGHAAVQALDVGQTLTDSYFFLASDGSSQVVTVTINGAEDTPTLDNAVADLSATESLAFSFTFAGNTFGDLDASDTLTYTATLSDNSPLPAWLSFDGLTRTFTGTPGVGDIGAIDIRIIADDGSSTVSDIFTLTVDPFNNAPLIGGVDTATVTEDSGLVAGNLTVAGALTIADADIGESSFVGETITGAYGSLVIDAAGNWSYSADNSQAAIQSLRAGESVTDTLSVTTADGSTHDIAITIDGAEEAAPPPVVEPPVVEPPPEEEIPPPEEEVKDEDDGGEDGILEEITRLPQGSTPPVTERDESDLVKADEPEGEAVNFGPAAVKQVPDVAQQPQVLQAQNLNVDSLTLQVSDDEALNEQYELELLNRIDSMHLGMDSDGARQSADDVNVQIIVGSTTGLTVGIVSWVLRGGALLASFMSTVPLLNRFDPLPILKTREDKEEVEPDEDDDTRINEHAKKVDNMFSGKDSQQQQFRE